MTHIMNIRALSVTPGSFAKQKTPSKYSDCIKVNKASTNCENITINKKKAIIGGGAILTAAAGITAIAISGKFKPNKILRHGGLIRRETDKLSQEINTLTNETYKYTGEIAENFKKTKYSLGGKFNEMMDGKKTECIIDSTLVKLEENTDKSTQKILSEFSEDGQTLLRRTVFERASHLAANNPNKELYYIKQSQDFINGTNKYNQIIFGRRLSDTNRNYIKARMEGVQEHENGTITADRVFEFQDFFDKRYAISKYAKTAEKTADGEWIGKQNLYFKKEKPSAYSILENKQETFYRPQEIIKWIKEQK